MFYFTLFPHKSKITNKKNELFYDKQMLNTVDHSFSANFICLNITTSLVHFTAR